MKPVKQFSLARFVTPQDLLTSDREWALIVDASKRGELSVKPITATRAIVTLAAIGLLAMEENGHE